MTEIAKPSERPRWASDVSADVITPSGAKQDTGWVQEYPPLQYFNWLGKYTYQWLDYLERNTDASLGGGALATVTISSGIAIPATGVTPVDTEAAAATDDLTNLSVVNLAPGRIVIVSSVNAGRVITVKHMAGGSGQINLRLGADIVLDNPKKVLVLVRNGTQWDELFGFLGSDPYPYLSADLDVRAKKITTSIVNGDVIVEPNGTGSLSPLTTGKALGKSAQRWNAFLSGANVAGNVSPEADGTRSLGSTGTRWGFAFADQISATDWVRTAAIDTESAGGTLAIGGTNASLINIGRTGATIALYGSITEVHTTNTYVTDKLLTLNDGGLAASGDGAGIEIEEGGSATGYLKVSTNRNKWSFKAPNDAAVISIGAEATVVGDIGLVSSVFTFMSNGFSFKNSAGNVIASATDAGAVTWGPLATYDAIDHMVYGQLNIRSTTDASLHFYEGSTKRWTLKCTGSNNGFDFTYAPTGSMGNISAGGVFTLGPDLSENTNLIVNGTARILQGNADSISLEMRGDEATSTCRIKGGGAFGDSNWMSIDFFGSATHANRSLAIQDADNTVAIFRGNGSITFNAGSLAGGFDLATSGIVTLGPNNGTGNNLLVNGYSALGNSATAGDSGTPAFAVKKLTGTWTANTATFSIAHGLSAARIKAVYGKIETSANPFAIPGYVSTATRTVTALFDNTSIYSSSYDTTFVLANYSTSNRTITYYVIYEAS